MDPVTRPTPSSTQLLNTSKRSGPIRLTSSYGQAITRGPPILLLGSYSNRHDNDNHFPRSPLHIFDANREIRDYFYAIFKHENPLYPLKIPLIPSFGNNDVWP